MPTAETPLASPGQDLLGAAAASTAMVLVGSSVAAADALVAYPIAGGQALRYALAAGILLALARGSLPRIGRPEGIRLLALAACGLAGFNAFLIAAVRETDAATVGVIVGCVPVALALAGPLLERRALSPGVLAAALLVGAGAAAVHWSGGSLSPLGLALSFGALACEAAFSLLAVPLLASLGPLAVSTYACLLAAPLLAITGFALDETKAIPTPSAQQAAALVYLAAMVTAAGFVLWYTGIKRLGVERAGLTAGLLPVSALLTTAATGASELTPLRLLGALAVGAGVTAGITAPTRNPRTTLDTTPSQGRHDPPRSAGRIPPTHATGTRTIVAHDNAQSTRTLARDEFSQAETFDIDHNNDDARLA